MRSLVILSFIICLGVIVNLQGQDSEKSTTEPITGESDAILFKNSDISLFSGAVIAAGLKDLFVGTGPWTAFVPTNKAIEKFGMNKWNQYLKPENRDQLMDILTYHVIPGKYLSKNMKSERVKTAEGRSIDIQVHNGVIKVNNATVVKKDLVGPNGVIHEIDRVLMP